MKLSELISSPEHRAEMWRKLYFCDPYFHRLWEELEHWNARQCLEEHLLSMEAVFDSPKI